MGLLSILYVSTCNLGGNPGNEIDKILAVSRWNNAKLGITGAIAYTGGQFAQCIEGPATVVEALLARITADPRHGDVSIVQRSDINERQFSGWSMAYAGPSLFVKRTLYLSLAGRRVAAERLLRLLKEFSTQ